MKGIILAGGTGTRLWPLTKATSKQLLPVYDKPLIYYPLSTLMLAGIREYLIITTPHELTHFENLLGNGSRFGISIQYTVQPYPEGIAQAFLLAGEFISNQKVALILGDNIFHGQGLGSNLQRFANLQGSHIFTYEVSDPRSYGVLEIDSNKMPVSIAEKPKVPKSNLAVTGLYFFDEHVKDYAKKLKPSTRGELEITDLLRIYLESQQLDYSELSIGTTWLDCGTFDSLNDASNLIKTIQHRSKKMVACPEEIALNSNWFDVIELNSNLNSYGNNNYSRYLSNLVKSKLAK